MQHSIWIMLVAVALLAVAVLLSPRAPNSYLSETTQPVRAPELPDFVVEMPSGSLASVALSEDGRRLAVARNFVSEQEGRAINMTELKLFDLDSGQALWTASYENPNCCGLPIVKITPDALFVLGAGKQLHLYSQDGQELKTLSFQEDDEFTLLSAQLSADGRYIAATSSHRAYLFSSEGEQLWSAKFPEVPTAALSSDGRYLLVATPKRFQLHQTTDLKLIQEGELSYEEPAVAAAISTEGSMFAIAGNRTSGSDALTVYIVGGGRFQA